MSPCASSCATPDSSPATPARWSVRRSDVVKHAADLSTPSANAIVPQSAGPAPSRRVQGRSLAPASPDSSGPKLVEEGRAFCPGRLARAPSEAGYLDLRKCLGIFANERWGIV